MNQDDANKIITEGLKAIDEETAQDEEIREISAIITDELIKNMSKGLETHITDLNGNWLLDYYIYNYGDKRYVKLRCFNETRMIMAPNYRPLIIDAEIDEEYDAEDALYASVTAFVAKMYNKFIVECLDKDDE